ncbi:MAG: tRNA pseudouridine(38-40) synthase TruA [Deltaproteobacteria bacterium]|nr:tRNA pseudouridine(38-40) synthase TruA [Deltaproteobacteria bacterium]
MRNIKLILEYDGTAYHGWQVQKNARSIQSIVEKALFTLLREKVKAIASGRTDAGVHAMNQPVSFKTGSAMETRRLLRGLNGILPKDIVVKSVEEISSDFDARRSSKKKTYRYVILNREAPSALDRERCWHIRPSLDLEVMEKGAKMLLGKHDFSSFRASGCGAEHAVRRVLNVAFEEKGEGCIHFEITAYAFLKQMVRNIVGTLVALGLGKMTIEEFSRLLEAKDRTKAGATAPPQGLFLIKVEY